MTLTLVSVSIRGQISDLPTLASRSASFEIKLKMHVFAPFELTISLLVKKYSV